MQYLEPYFVELKISTYENEIPFISSALILKFQFRFHESSDFF